jgi:hypothetical protein
MSRIAGGSLHNILPPCPFLSAGRRDRNQSLRLVPPHLSVRKQRLSRWTLDRFGAEHRAEQRGQEHRGRRRSRLPFTGRGWWKLGPRTERLPIRPGSWESLHSVQHLRAEGVRGPRVLALGAPAAPALCSGAQPDRGPGPPKKYPQRAMPCPSGSQVRGTRDPLPLRPTLSQEGTACVPRGAPSEQPEAMPPGSLARGAPKVADLDPAVGHQKEIVWLEVKVEELLRV